MSTSNNNTKVCVTGASGYVAGHVVRELLEAGYHVIGTVRHIGSASTEHLTLDNLVSPAYRANGGKLTLVEADLCVEGSFDNAVKGCTYVIHTASPFLITTANNDPENNLIKPAVEGTRNILSSCNKEPSVVRVVLTSSVVSIYDTVQEHGDGYVLTEADWNSASTLKTNPYALSKVMAEKEAIKIAEQASWDLVVICPGLVMGPSMSKRTNDGSIGFIKAILNGEWYIGAELNIGIVDVRDVGKAHFLAMTVESAEGRYITVNKSLWPTDIAEDLKPEYNDKWLPTYYLPKPVCRLIAYMVDWFGVNLPLTHDLVDGLGMKLVFSNDKIKKDLGMTFRDTKKTFVDMADSMK